MKWNEIFTIPKGGLAEYINVFYLTESFEIVHLLIQPFNFD